MKGIDQQYTSIQQMTDQYLNQRIEKRPAVTDQITFEEVLRQKQFEAKPLKFSKHAAMRLESRNINLSSEQSERLSEGVQKAGEKGIRDSLVIVDSLAFIVNIPNKTVVTAMEQSEADRNVFTNIDGAVII